MISFGTLDPRQYRYGAIVVRPPNDDLTYATGPVNGFGWYVMRVRAWCNADSSGVIWLPFAVPPTGEAFSNNNFQGIEPGGCAEFEPSGLYRHSVQMQHRATSTDPEGMIVLIEFMFESPRSGNPIEVQTQ